MEPPAEPETHASVIAGHRDSLKAPILVSADGGGPWPWQALLRHQPPPGPARRPDVAPPHAGVSCPSLLHATAAQVPEALGRATCWSRSPAAPLPWGRGPQVPPSSGVAAGFSEAGWRMNTRVHRHHSTERLRTRNRLAITEAGECSVDSRPEARRAQGPGGVKAAGRRIPSCSGSLAFGSSQAFNWSDAAHHPEGAICFRSI